MNGTPPSTLAYPPFDRVACARALLAAGRFVSVDHCRQAGILGVWLWVIYRVVSLSAGTWWRASAGIALVTGWK